jgi:hypothetical protein
MRIRWQTLRESGWMTRHQGLSRRRDPAREVTLAGRALMLYNYCVGTRPHLWSYLAAGWRYWFRVPVLKGRQVAMTSTLHRCPHA